MKILSQALNLALMVALVAAAPMLPANADEEVTVSRKFSGKIADPELKTMQPETGVIVDADHWQTLWAAWRPNQPVPKLDFQTQLAIVNIVPGPNTVFANKLKLDDQNDLKFEVASTRMAGPGFGYLIMVVPKSKIESINGVALGAKPIANKPPTASANETPSNQASPPTTTPNPPMPSVTPVDTRAVGEESVSVEIVGGVRTDIPSTGVETTGSLIAANNIVWELDFQNKEALLQAARNVGDSLARVKGKLVMQRGTDARSRFILKVESIERLDLLPPPNAFSDRGNREIANNKQANRVADDPTNDTTTGNEDPNNTSNIPLENSIADPAALNSFDNITLVTSDGQTQIISRDGVVVYTSSAKNTTSEWIIKPETLARLRQFVSDTDWAMVPRDNRGKNSGEELGFMVSVESSQSVTRVYIDASMVAGQPVMKEFFEHVRQVGADRK